MQNVKFLTVEKLQDKAKKFAESEKRVKIGKKLPYSAAPKTLFFENRIVDPSFLLL